jgi:hypothetical protein
MAYDDTMKEGGNAMDLAITDVENIIDNASPEEAIEMMTSQMKAEKDPNAKKAYQDGIDRVKRGLATENSDVSILMNEGVEAEMSNYMVDQMDLNPYDFYFDDTVLYVDPKHYLDVYDELGDYAEKRFYKIKKMEAPDLESLQYNEAIGVGDMVKVKDQEIIGKVVSDFGNKIVIRDEDAETDDDELEFKKSDVELYPYPGLDEAGHKNVGDVSFKDKDPLPGKFQGFGISQSPQYRAKAKKILDKMGIKHFDSGTKGLMIHSKPEDQEMIMRAIKTELGTPSYTATFYEDIERVIEAYGANNPKYDEKAVERELQKAGIAPRSRQAKAVHALLKGRQQDEQAQSPYAIGMAKAMKMYKDKPPLSKRTIKKAHSIAKGVMGEAAKPLKVKALSDNAKEMLKKALKSKAGRSRYNYGDTIELEVDNPEDVPDQLMQAIHDELEQEAIQGGMLKAKDVGKYPDRIDNIKISAKAQEHPELPGAFFPKVNITGEYMKEEKTNTMEAEAGPHMAGKSSWTHSAKGGRVKYKDSKGKEFSSEVNSITTRRFRDDTDTISGEVELEMGDIGSSKSYFITDNPNLHKEVMNIIKKSSGVGMSPVIRSANDVNIDPNGNITLRDVDVDSLNKYMDKAGSPIIPYQALVKKYPTLKGHFMSLPGGKAAVGHMDVDQRIKDSVEIKEGPTSDRAAEIVADIANSQEGGYFETEEALEQFLSDNLPSFSDKDYDHMKAVEKAMNMIDDHVKGYAYEDNTVKFNEEIQRMKYLAGQSKVLENEHRGYANSPKEQIIDSDTKLNKMSGGANKPKKTYPKVAGGDNPMQKVEEDTSALEKALQEELEIIKKED